MKANGSWMIVAALLALAATGIPALAAVEVEANGDSAAKKEAEGSLKLDMRVDGTTQFVYPCIYEEQDNPNRTKYIQYKAKDKAGQAGSITKITIQVLDKNSQVVWEKDDLAKSDTWKDSSFRTRTNKDGSTDADNHANYLGPTGKKRFKFIDPSSSNFTAKLIITTKKGDLTATAPFAARVRDIFWCHESADDVGARGKTYMWKVFGLNPGDNGPCQDPAEKDSQVYFDPTGKSFTGAYDCVTPRGKFWTVGHGEPGVIYLGGAFLGGADGFKGPSCAAGTGGSAPCDLTDHAEMHKTVTDLIHCFTNASQPIGGGACVRDSFKNSIENTAGGGGSVRGYDDIAACKYPEYFVEITPGDTNLNQGLKDKIKGYASEEAFAILKSATPAWVEQHEGATAYWLTPGRIDAEPIKTILYQFTVAEKTQIVANAKQKLQQNDNPPEGWTWALTSVQTYYAASQAFVNPAGTAVDIP